MANNFKICVRRNRNKLHLDSAWTLLQDFDTPLFFWSRQVLQLQNGDGDAGSSGSSYLDKLFLRC